MIAMISKQSMRLATVHANSHLARSAEFTPGLICGMELLAAFTAQRFAQARGTLPDRTEL